MVRLQVQMHTDKLEQPNQLYLKEVGSLNAGAPARQSMRARVPPYPARVGPGIPPPWCGARLFYSLGARAVWRHEWCHSVMSRREHDVTIRHNVVAPCLHYPKLRVFGRVVTEKESCIPHVTHIQTELVLHQIAYTRCNVIFRNREKLYVIAIGWSTIRQVTYHVTVSNIWIYYLKQ